MAAVGSITTTTENIGGGYTVYSCAWTADASGAVSGIDVPMARGFVHQVKFIPGTAGNAPTALYDVTLVDADAVDFLGGSGADLSATVAAIKAPILGSSQMQPFWRGGSLQPTVANAGNAKTGTILVTIGP